MAKVTDWYPIFPKPIGGVVASRPAASLELQLLIYMASDAAWAICLDGAWVDLPGGGGITDITSTDGTITVTNPTGPTTDLAIAFTDLREEAFSASQTVAPGGTDLTWAHSSGDSLLDYTTPALPTVVVAGLYMFACTIATPQEAGIFGSGALILDFGGTLPLTIFASAPLDGTPDEAQAYIGMSMTAYLPAGAEVKARLGHSNASDITDVALDVLIQQIIAA